MRSTSAGPATPNEVIAAAALRVVSDLDALREAHDDHGFAPGPHDDLADDEYAAAAAEIHRQTLSDEVVGRLGVLHGQIVSVMDAFAGHHPGPTDQPKWQSVRRYHAAMSAAFTRFGEPAAKVPAVALVAKPTPAILRFDLLAGLASRAAVLRMIDAAGWVAALAGELPAVEDPEIERLLLETRPD